MTHSRLSAISTAWSLIGQAHGGHAAARQEACTALLQRYSVAAWKYLRAALGNDDDASDLFQEFALRFVQKCLPRADPRQGRFRDFLKSVLSNLINDYWRQRQRQHLLGPPDELPVPEEPAPRDARALFREVYREAVLDSAFRVLERCDTREGKPLFHALRLWKEMVSPSHAELAAGLGQILRREVSTGTSRVYLHEARSLYADLIVAEVVQTLSQPTQPAVEAELAELGLLEVCREALARHFAV